MTFSKQQQCVYNCTNLKWSVHTYTYKLFVCSWALAKL